MNKNHGCDPKSEPEPIEATEQEFDPIFHEISVMRQIILERVHPLELLRELVSNAAAREVGATEIRVKYTVDELGHIFEVVDNGCGMNYTGDPQNPGRLDRFFGLGLSNVVGIKSDEFAWKGLGSKLAYHSRRIEINTVRSPGEAHRVEINEPWETIERKQKPRPKIFHYTPERGADIGTSIRVVGHPPHRREDPFTTEEIEAYLLHRTFGGFTQQRTAAPKLMLSVLGKTKTLRVGFPELRRIQDETTPEGTLPVNQRDELTKPGTNKTICAGIKGFITWDADQYGLEESRYNCGLILSVGGIPYCEMDLSDAGSRSIGISNPGWKNCCLILECDGVQEDMNMSRSGLVDSENVDLLYQLTAKMFREIESGQDYLDFRQIPKERKIVKGVRERDVEKQKLESENQKWVVWIDPAKSRLHVLVREPQNENDVLLVLWKLEALRGLPFVKFETLAHTSQGPDLVVHFQEDAQSDPERYASVEVENRFSSYKPHGHTLPSHPRVICWDMGSSPKLRIRQTDKAYKSRAEGREHQVDIFCLKKLPDIRLLTRSEIEDLSRDLGSTRKSDQE